MPIVWFFRPKQLVNDVWRASAPEPKEGSGEVWRRPVPALLGVWWTGWVVLNLGSTVAERYSRYAEELPELQTATVAYLLSDALGAVTALLAWIVVRRTTRRQEARAAVLGAAAPAVPAAPEPAAA